MMKASKNFRNSKKDIWFTSPVWGMLKCITQQPTVVFVGRWPMTLAEVWKIVIWSRSSKRAVMMFEFKRLTLNVRFSQRRMSVSYVFPICFLLFPMCFPCVSYVFLMCFLCVSHVFHVLYFLRPVLFFSLFWGLLCNSRCHPLTKLAIGYHKKWETYATAPRSTNYSSYFS